MWGGSKIIKINKNGELLGDINLNYNYPTNCKLHGSKIFITSAKLSDDEMITTTAFDPEYPDTERCNVSDGKLFTADLF